MPTPTPDDAGSRFLDPVIEAYKQDVDRTLLRENLKLTPSQRFERFVHAMRGIFQLQRAGEASRSKTQ